MLGRCLAVFATTHLLSVGSLTALLLLLQHALRNSSTAPTLSTHDSLSFVHVGRSMGHRLYRVLRAPGRPPERRGGEEEVRNSSHFNSQHKKNLALAW